MGNDFFAAFELGDTSDSMGLDKLCSDYALADIEVAGGFDTVPGSPLTLVRPADGTLWEIQGDRVVRVNRASNIVEF